MSMLDTHLQSNAIKNQTIENFLATRIKVKSLHNEIVSLKAKEVQLIHQKRKDDVIRAGGKPRFLLLKSRRMGMTTWEQSLSYRATVSQPNTTCVTLADNKFNTKTIFRMVTLMARLDPKQPKGLQETKVSIEVPSLNSLFYIGTAGSRSFSRGDNVYRAHGSEVAWWPGDFDTIENLVVGITEAARHGEVIFETTANGASGWYYEKFKEAMAGGNHWNALFYPWYLDPENMILPTPLSQQEFYDTVTTDEMQFQNENNLTLPQMLWRRDKHKELKKLFLQEYPETWVEAFLIRGNSFWDAELIDSLIKKIKKPLTVRENLIIWKKAESGRQYCAGGDTSEGNVNSDSSVCAILDKETGEQVAVLRGKWRPEVFARKAIALCIEYNEAIFACEINNHGHSVMNTVMNTLHYKHIFYRKKPLDRNKFDQQKEENIPGWHTNASTRPLLLDDLNEAMESGFMQVNDETFLAECKTFVDNGGRYEADEGQHDDSIIAWGIAWQCRKHKKKSYII